MNQNWRKFNMIGKTKRIEILEEKMDKIVEKIDEIQSKISYIQTQNLTQKPQNTEVKCYHRAIGKENQINMHHPEMYTFPRFCKSKGVKNVKFFAGFPDHSFEKIISMVDLGLASDEHINVNGVKVKPIEFMRENLKRGEDTQEVEDNVQELFLYYDKATCLFERGEDKETFFSTFRRENNIKQFYNSIIVNKNSIFNLHLLYSLCISLIILIFNLFSSRGFLLKKTKIGLLLYLFNLVKIRVW